MTNSLPNNDRPRLEDRLAGVVLCGGHSRRMGYPKAALPFGPESMLQRVIRLLATVAEPIVAVVANDEHLDAAEGVLIARDRAPDQGPLEGLRAGLAALPDTVDRAYATSCDVPLLNTAFVQMLQQRMGTAQIAVASDEQYRHPLAAIYRRTVLGTIEELLAADQRRPAFLFDRCDTVFVSTHELKSVDPELNTLRNLNHAADYEAALRDCGLEMEPSIRDQLKWPTD